MNELRTCHLFAGHGGGLLADLILGHRPVVAVEWDKYACQVLRERAADGWFPGLSVWEGDVRLFDPSEYAGIVDCIHAGFPCQDISVAGKQAGLGEGTRSGLYREILRIAGVVRPRYLFLENVSAILSNGLGVVLGDLAALGYDTRWLCIRASDVGAPHHRDRWFGLCTMGNAEHDGQLAEPQLQGHEAASHERGAQESQQTGKFAGADRPADVPGIRRGADGSEQTDVLPNINNCRCRDGQIQHISGQQQCTANACNDGEEGYVADTASPRLEGQQREELKGARNGFADKSQILADTHNQRCQERNFARITAESGWDGGSVDAGRGAGWWEVESDVGRVADGVPNRVHRLKGLGNAQVPMQAAIAYTLLKQQLDEAN